MAEVVLRQVTKTFEETVAVESLDLAVADGEFVVLLGPTGAGKTTTLRLVAGLERPETGTVSIGGRDVTRLDPAERDVTFVFQQYSLYPHYTVFENMAFPLRSPKQRWPRHEIEERVREITTLLRLESKLGNRATQLSGGEMQRVAIGRALVRRPAVFLMDEPLSSLDAKLREDLRVELKRIQLDLGATIVYVTHDQIEAMTLADRIGVLSHGRLVQIGTPRQVYAEPDTVEVAQRLGSPNINLLPMGALGVEQGPGGAVSFGIRPEDLTLGTEGRPGRVVTAEHLGAETVLLLEVEGQRLHVLAAPGEVLQEGSETRVSPRLEATLYFDSERRRIPWGAAPSASEGASAHGG